MPGLLNIIKAYFFIWKFLKEQLKFNKVFIYPYLEPYYFKHDKKLTKGVLTKIKNYYTLGIPLTCDAYLKVYGRGLNNSEAELATLTGIMTPIIDDFTDLKTLSNQEIDHLTYFPNEYVPKTIEEDIVKNILIDLLSKVKNPEGFLESLKRTIQAQHLSQQQLIPGLSYEELLRISWAKGGYSHTFFHYLIDERPSGEMTNVLYQLGGVCQMCNDIFDVYKDFKEGIHTFANTCSDYSVLKRSYLEECQRFCSMARKLPQSPKEVEFFIAVFASVMGRGIVALERLEKLQLQKGGGSLTIGTLDRKQLICDMEKPVNILAAIWFAARIIK